MRSGGVNGTLLTFALILGACGTNDNIQTGATDQLTDSQADPAYFPVNPNGADVIRQLAGCFEVSFRFVENEFEAKQFRTVTEHIDLIEQDGALLLQHRMILDGQAMTHWREEWRSGPEHEWTQRVIGPYEDFRYECTTAWVFNQWRCRTDAAIPRRDETRTDYAKLDRENTLQVVPDGWIHAQRNVKRDSAGAAVSIELGWNEYKRIDDVQCEVSPAPPADSSNESEDDPNPKTPE